MNKEEYDKLSTFDKIEFDIAMKSYDKHNSKIASIYDHLGEMFSYSDLQEAKEYELQDEMRMYRDALKEKCDAIDSAIKLLQSSQIYTARSNGKTLFMQLIEEEINILKGAKKGII